MKCYQVFLISLCNYIFLLCSTSEAQTTSGVAPAIKLKAEFSHDKQPCPKPSSFVTAENCVLGTLFGKLTMKCMNDGGPWNSSMTLAWYRLKDGDDNANAKDPIYEPMKGTNDGRVKVFDDQVEFTMLSAQDITLYACKVALKKSSSDTEELTPLAQEVIQVQARPLVTPIMKDMTAVEGSTMNVTCAVTGKATRVVWKFGDKIMNNMTDSRVSLVPFRKVQDATLLIQHANSTTDRGHYNCTAESLYGSSTNYGLSHVRIKSKYAALAPFLGICAEVIILCTIILIYEKKRDKTELEESDTDQGPETKSSPDHGQDSVRYRK